MAYDYLSLARKSHYLSAETRDLVVLSLFFSSLLLGVSRIGPLPFPVWFLALPIVLWRFPPRRPHIALAIVAVAYLGVVVQAATGHVPTKEDVGVYVPAICTAICLTLLTGVRVSDQTLYRALMIAGLFLCATILVGITNRCVAAGEYSLLNAYQMKGLTETPLGRSNYLAVFLVFFFNVALHKRSSLAIIFAAVTLLTLSRSALAFLAISILVWLALFWLKPSLIAGAIAVGFVAIMALQGGSVVLFELATQPTRILFSAVADGLMSTCARVQAADRDTLSHFPDGVARSAVQPPDNESTMIRADLVRSALPSVAAHPAFGVPRSEFRKMFPTGHHLAHGWLVDITLLLGTFGLIAYLAYLALGISGMPVTGPWLGVRVGLVLTLIWGVIEIVLLTPAYDTLFAALIAITQAVRRHSAKMGCRLG